MVSDSDGKIDVEDPAPGVVVGDPSSQRWTDRWRHDRGDSVKREGQAALLRREGIGQNGLGHRLESAAAHSLDDAENNQQRPGSGRRRTTES